jgi:acetyl esterase/lipase
VVIRRTVAAALAVALLGALLTALATPVGAGRAETTTEDGVVVTRDITYGTAPDEHGQTENLLLDLYQPADPGEAPRPAVVWVHGGGFATGDKAEAPDVAAATEFARSGYVAVSVNYRLQPDSYPEYPVAAVDAQHDVQAAVRWLRSRAAELGIDPTRISVGGFSAGAITALRVGAFPDDPGDSGTPGVSSAVASVVAASGFLRADIPAGAPPLLLVNGGQDPIVPPEWVEETCERWQASGASCHRETYEEASHDLTTHFTEIVALVKRFFACRVGSPIGFPDVRLQGRAAPSVSWVVAHGVAEGYPDGTFRPHRGLTRNQMANWLWDFLGEAPGIVGSRTAATRAQAARYLWEMTGSAPVASATGFPDVDPAKPYAPAIDWLVAHGIATGFRDGTFRPAAAVTRAQFAGFLRVIGASPDAWGDVPDRPLCFDV